MPEVPADLNVFRRPHSHMKQLVKDTEEELHLINFSDGVARQSMLAHLLSRFREFKCHEEIENQYIVKELVPRLPSHTLATLQNDLHSDNRLNELVCMVDSGLELGEENEGKLAEFGEKLKLSIFDFNLDFIPHMDEEEQTILYKKYSPLKPLVEPAEGERVFLPLLLEHFSETELRRLTSHVLELHHLGPSPPPSPPPSLDHTPYSPVPPAEKGTDSAHLLSLPNELLLQIFSRLSPLDLLRVSQTHPDLRELALDGSLWAHMHPVRWAAGRWNFFSPPDINKKALLLDGLIEQNDVTKELLSAGTSINANLLQSGCRYDDDEDAVHRELEVLRGVIDHILPRVGEHVQTLDLSHGKAVSNEIVYRMLRLCPNLKYLDLSYTKISDFALKGLLCKNHNRWLLEYLDLSNCSMITNLSLQKLAQSLGPSHSCYSTCATTMFASCPMFRSAQWDSGKGVTTRGAEGGGGGGGGKGSECGALAGSVPRLKCLVLSGCYLVTDIGLRYLSAGPGLPMLQYLNLSGLPAVTQKGLSALVASSPRLPPDLLFYCDNITAGPYADTANGCQNYSHDSNIHCCRMRM